MTYSPPTGPELRALMRRWQLTGSRVAALVGCNPRTVRKWCAKDAVDGDGGIKFAELYTLASRANGEEITPDNWRAVLRPGVEP